ncbi:MAG: DUF2306 domain-containing protein [Pikeienuella sp.]|uniref:DUF2306 domain-containing protein n=1 Tax=Pikeienuella sp. TaxID=2831957 RepID=UPI00391A40F9
MTLSPFLTAPVEIQFHIVAALLGVVLGPFVLFRRRRDRLHKTLGYLWIGAMAVLAIGSFAIPSHLTEIGLGPLHAFAALTLWSLQAGLRAALARDFERHQAIFRSLYLNGLIIAGAFTFLPGRAINRMVFGEPSQLGWAVIVACLLAVALRLVLPRLRGSLRA